jgi:ABC-type nitrate/sulfonate/bicarbonate transport system permease component
MSRYIALGPIAVIAIWLLVSHTHLIDEIFLPKPESVASALWTSFANKSILPDIQMTTMRWLVGLLIGVVIGVPLGVAMGASRLIYESLEIVVDFFRSIPTMTLFPLFLVFFGIGDKAKIFIAAWSTVLYVLINTLYGVRHAKESRIKVAKVFRANKWNMYTKVIIPDALPSIFVGVRIALSMSLVIVVASEMIMGTTLGLGRRIFDSALVYAMPDMYGAIIIAGLLGYTSNKLFVIVESRIVHWTSK